MIQSPFAGLFESNAGLMTLPTFLACLLTALVLGMLETYVYRYRSTYSRTFLRSVALLPGIICVVIMMVRGSLGAGLVIAGIFSLIRFRSVPGTAKEIMAIFLSSAIGIACGMGYPLFALLFGIVISVFYLAYEQTGFGASKDFQLRKTLRITVPEDLEYATMFDEIFARYTTQHELVRVKTTNLGSLNRLSYNLTLKDAKLTKPMIDELRVLNGNLEISLTLQQTEQDIL